MEDSADNAIIVSWYGMLSPAVWYGMVLYGIVCYQHRYGEARVGPVCRRPGARRSVAPPRRTLAREGWGEPPLVWPSTGRQKGRSVPSEDGSLWVLSSCHCSMNSSGDCSLSFPPCPFCSSLCSYPGHSSSFHLPSSAPPPSPDSSSPLPSPGVRIPGSST